MYSRHEMRCNTTFQRKLCEDKMKLKEITKGKSQGFRVYDPSGISVTLSAVGGGSWGEDGFVYGQSKRSNRKRVR